MNKVKINISNRYAAGRHEFSRFDMQDIVDNFLVRGLFMQNHAELVYTHYDRLVVDRTINKLFVTSTLDSCQLQMGLTELAPGSVWNTMPAHTHARRMETYFYLNVPENDAVCHFMGPPDETKHVWVGNEEAVVSPPWSIHSGVGTSNYSFIWGMAGENVDYADMDTFQPCEFRHGS